MVLRRYVPFGYLDPLVAAQVSAAKVDGWDAVCCQVVNSVQAWSSVPEGSNVVPFWLRPIFFLGISIYCPKLPLRPSVVLGTRQLERFMLQSCQPKSS